MGLDYPEARHPNPNRFDAPTDPTGRLATAEVFGMIGYTKVKEQYGTPSHHEAQMEVYRAHVAEQEAKQRAAEENALWMQDFRAAQEKGLSAHDAIDAANQAAEIRKQGAAGVQTEVRTEIAESMGSV